MNEHCNEVDSTEESLPLPDDFRKVLEMKNVIFLLADEVERLARISAKDCGGFDDAGGFEHLFDNCLMRFDRTGVDQKTVRDALERLVQPLLSAYFVRISYLLGRLAPIQNQPQ